jgi:DNA-binding beta-propeller fold protein YncE
MPLALAVAPEGDRVAVLLNGWREQGVQIVNPATGQITQDLRQPAAFLGLAFSPDGQWLFASGGNQDVVYRYAWRDRQATLRDSIVLGVKRFNSGTRYPAGLAVSRDGRALYVAENLADSLAVVDLSAGTVVQRFATQRYPYGVVVGPRDEVYVSAWGGTTVSVFRPEGGNGWIAPAGRWQAGRHPSALLLNGDGSRLFVASGSTDKIAVLDTRDGRLVTELSDAAPTGPREGSTPNALALSANGRRLFVAEADNNAVAVFDLSSATAQASAVAGRDTLAGRVPTGWYPSAVAVRGDTLLVVNGKGRGTAPNRALPHPGTGTQATQPRAYTLGQLSGSLTVSMNANAGGAALAGLTTRVANANNWNAATRPSPYPPIRYVIYVIKENRSYDQVFGDLSQGDGDTSLVFFPRANSPNHHALAERFGLFDRFFVNAEVSPDGHNWSTAAYATDYLEKTVPSNYSSRGRSYDYEGTNRGRVPADQGETDVAEPASGYLWDLVQRAGLTLRNYGEFVIPDRLSAGAQVPPSYRGLKPFLAANTNRDFPTFDLDIPDQRRADIFIAEFQQLVRDGRMPRLTIVRLPNDHTAGARAGAPTPRAYMADNDLALGRIVAAISATPIWRETAIFVLEDDAQNGPDHVDSHRSPFLVISPYARRGVYHRFTNTTDVLATMEEILGLSSLSQFDHFGRPLRDIWTGTPDLRPYALLTPSVPLTERNPQSGRDAEDSKRLALDVEDMADEDLFNRILWRVIKGDSVPFPGVTRMSALEWKRSR